MASLTHHKTLPLESALLSLCRHRESVLEATDPFPNPQAFSVQQYDQDIPMSLLEAAQEVGLAAWDIETSGLDWHGDRIATCQIFVPGLDVALVRVHETRPLRLIELLASRQVVKIFHHAMFDLRFLVHYWDVTPENIVCTKIAAKLLDRENARKNSLQALLSEYLDIHVDKAQQTSDWFREVLTFQQTTYAASDVIYLPQLFSILSQRLLAESLFDLGCKCFEHIPTRARLDVLGYQDVYVY